MTVISMRSHGGHSIQLGLTTFFFKNTSCLIIPNKVKNNVENTDAIFNYEMYKPPEALK